MNGRMMCNGENVYIEIKYLEIERKDNRSIDIFLGYCSHQVSLALVLFHVCKLRTAKFNFQAKRLQ